MPENKRFKLAVRDRMASTGEAYMEAARVIRMLATIPGQEQPVRADGDEPGWPIDEALADLRSLQWPVMADDQSAQIANTAHAGMALQALASYAEEAGSDQGSLLSDFLADVMHLCDALGVDFGAQVTQGRRHYDDEIHDRR